MQSLNKQTEIKTREYVQFTRLRLNGFKSFVDPTDFLIEPGLTGIVGPNGCGKSNLFEALCWVMGENRPTAMRGGGMEDVIFSGTATRPVRNFAEVVIGIDNSDYQAPAAFNAKEQIEVVRRVTRGIGSAYKVNGDDARARDVHMLFADASSGAHSPAMVRQGQIAELINARPKARRRVLEEAAGISGLHQRRHEAELKLRGAETNLARVQDVLETLSSQLAVLERQVRQAKRYRDIGGKLRAAEGRLLYRKWWDFGLVLADDEAGLSHLIRAFAEAETALAEKVRLRESTVEALPSLREDAAHATARLQRLTHERGALEVELGRATEVIGSVRGQLERMALDSSREGQLYEDAGATIADLEREGEGLERLLEGHQARLSAADNARGQARSVLETKEQEAVQKAEQVAQLVARHDAQARLVADCRDLLEKNLSEQKKAVQARAEGQRAMQEAEKLFEENVLELERAQKRAQAGEEALSAAEAARAQAQELERESRAGLSALESEEKALMAEHAALDGVVRQERGDDKALIDALEVTEGYENAFGAALDDDLNAPLTREGSGRGWRALEDYAEKLALPAGLESLEKFVSAPAELKRRIAQIGLVPADKGKELQPFLQPGQRLVSIEGDLWRWDGYQAPASERPTAAALRLQQLNRLEKLKREIAASTTRRQEAQGSHQNLKAAFESANAAERAAREARRQGDEALASATRAHARAQADKSLCEGRLDGQKRAVDRFTEEVEIAQKNLNEAQAATNALPPLETARGEAEMLRTKVEDARTAMLEVAQEFETLRQEGVTRQTRLNEITKSISSWKDRLAHAQARIAEMKTRQSDLNKKLLEAEAAPVRIGERKNEIEHHIEAAEAAQDEAKKALERAETAHSEADAAERTATREVSEVGEKRARAEARVEASKEMRVQAQTRIIETCEQKPEDLAQALKIVVEKLETAEALENQVTGLHRQRDALGAVNLQAEDDAREASEKHEQLKAEKEDLEAAFVKLRGAIESLNREGRKRIFDAFEEVNKNFTTLFTLLFRGGTAQLVLVESEDPLEAGLDILCQPPGKKLANLSLLSGGEQTLTALALILAVFLVNPAPICVLDEVDAPLDDVNIQRFCDLLFEMVERTKTRFLVITHHAITMARMDRLYGVTMAEQGVSQLVSVDLKKAEELTL